VGWVNKDKDSACRQQELRIAGEDRKKERGENMKAGSNSTPVGWMRLCQWGVCELFGWGEIRGVSPGCKWWISESQVWDVG